ncbi:MAG: hypothetical protein Kow0098_08720 [Ignavibacteriaceae bacterium]
MKSEFINRNQELLIYSVKAESLVNNEFFLMPGFFTTHLTGLRIVFNNEIISFLVNGFEM